jgi:hypothetical protein
VSTFFNIAERCYITIFNWRVTAISKSSSSRSIVNKVAQFMKQLTLSINIDQVTGLPSVDLGIGSEQTPMAFERTLGLIAEIHQDHQALLIFDVFQDISFVKSLPAKIRSALQLLPGDLPVLVLGSKKQLFSQMFADPRAPFASWGRHLELPPISADDYHEYIHTKFKSFGLSMSLDLTKFLLNEMQHIPEAINIVCDKMTKMQTTKSPIDKNLIAQVIHLAVEERSSLFRERLHRFTEKEIQFLRQIALDQPVAKPLAKSFVSATRLSVGGLQAMVSRLENEAMIYRLEEGYVVNDPLLQRFLARGL